MFPLPHRFFSIGLRKESIFVDLKLQPFQARQCPRYIRCAIKIGAIIVKQEASTYPQNNFAVCEPTNSIPKRFEKVTRALSKLSLLFAQLSSRWPCRLELRIILLSFDLILPFALSKFGRCNCSHPCAAEKSLSIMSQVTKIGPPHQDTTTCSTQNFTS